MQHRAVQQIEVGRHDEHLLGGEHIAEVAIPDQAEEDGQPRDQIERQQPGPDEERAPNATDLPAPDLVHHAAEARLPGVHLDHLDALDDFVHEANPPVRAGGRFQSE